MVLSKQALMRAVNSVPEGDDSSELLNSASNPAGVLTLALLRGVEQVIAREDGNNA